MKKELVALVLAASMVVPFVGGCANSSSASSESAASASAETSVSASAEASAQGGSAADGVLGSFTMQTIDGEDITEQYFADHKVTLVNVMATWCGPCVAEMPELEELYQDKEKDGLGLLAVVTDLYEGSGSSSAPDNAKLIQEMANITFPMVVPNETFMKTLGYVQSVPTSYLIDSEGNVLGKAIEGSRDMQKWTQIVDEYLQ